MATDDLRFLEFGPFRFDVRNLWLTLDGQPVPLTPKAADLLLALLDGRGDVVSKEDLLKKVWADTFVEEGNLGFHIHAIREALRQGANGEQYVENVPRRGYRFAVPIRELSGDTVMDRQGTDASVAPGAQTGPGQVEQPLRVRRRMLIPALLATVAITVVVTLGVAVAFVRVQPTSLRVARYQQLTTDRQQKYLDRPLVTDGSRVYFRQAASSPTNWVAVTGGETVPVMEALRDFLILDVHPARREFLVVRRDEPVMQGQLWVVSSAGLRRNVGTIVALSAAWSPDGEWIGYTTDAGVFVARPDGTGSRRLALTEGVPDWLRWSPDGRRLRFTLNTSRGRESRQGIWEVAADGTGLHQLPIGTAASEECCGVWTPDGDHFLFESRLERRSQLWTRHERTGLLGRAAAEPLPLTVGPLSFSMPGISPDGSRLFALGQADRGELVRFDKTLRTFVPHLGGISAIWVAFSRDGQSVAYVRYPEGTLWRAHADGSQPRQLTTLPMQTDGCTWSPDGKWIAFRGSMPGGPYKVFLIPADGGQAKATIEEDREQGIPSWSADGTRVAFGGVPAVYGYGSGEAIQIYDRASRQFSVVVGSDNLWTPRWSPDGRYIAAVTIANRSLRLFDVKAGVWRAIAADHIDNQTWSKDSRFIYYHTEGGVQALRRVRIPTGEVEDVVSLEGYPLRVYWWSGLSLDDSPLVLRHLGSPELYALDLERR